MSSGHSGKSVTMRKFCVVDTYGPGHSSGWVNEDTRKKTEPVVEPR